MSIHHIYNFLSFYPPPIDLYSFLHGKNSSLNFTKMFKICGHRYFRNRILSKPQMFSDKSAELSSIFTEISTFHHEKFCKFSLTSFRKYLYPQFLNSSVKFNELFFACISSININHSYPLEFQSFVYHQ